MEPITKLKISFVMTAFLVFGLPTAATRPAALQTTPCARRTPLRRSGSTPGYFPSLSTSARPLFLHPDCKPSPVPDGTLAMPGNLRVSLAAPAQGSPVRPRPSATPCALTRGNHLLPAWRHISTLHGGSTPSLLWYLLETLTVE